MENVKWNIKLVSAMFPTRSLLEQSACRSWVEKPRRKKYYTSVRFTMSTKDSFQYRYQQQSRTTENYFQIHQEW